MKSVIKNEEVQEEYPCLKKSNGLFGEFVVLFMRDSTGTVVHSSSNHHSLGDYSSCWMEDQFKPFNGSIELSD